MEEYEGVYFAHISPIFHSVSYFVKFKLLNYSKDKNMFWYIYINNIFISIYYRGFYIPYRILYMELTLIRAHNAHFIWTCIATYIQFLHGEC